MITLYFLFSIHAPGWFVVGTAESIRRWKRRVGDFGRATSAKHVARVFAATGDEDFGVMVGHRVVAMLECRPELAAEVLRAIDQGRILVRASAEARGFVDAHCRPWDGRDHAALGVAPLRRSPAEVPVPRAGVKPAPPYSGPPPQRYLGLAQLRGVATVQRRRPRE